MIIRGAITLSIEQQNILLGFLLGLIPSFGVWTINKIYRNYKISKFSKMIYEEYVQVIEQKLKNIENENVSDLKRQIGELLRKIDYLLKNELHFLNVDYQFEYIRICEFAKTKLGKVDEEMKKYSFHDIHPTSDISDEINNANNSLKYLQNYLSDAEDYYKLKTEKTN